MGASDQDTDFRHASSDPAFEEQAMEFEEHAEETLNFLNEMKMKIFQTEEYVGMVLSYLRMEDMGNDLKFQWYPIGDIVAAGSSQIFPDLYFEKDPSEFSGQQGRWCSPMKSGCCS